MNKLSILFLTLSLIGFNQLMGQTIFMTGLGNPTAITFDGDTLYYSDQTSGAIYRVDDLMNPVAVQFVTGLVDPIEMKTFGSDLYVSQQTANKISKIDLLSPSPFAIDVVTGIGQPTGLQFKDSVLYFADITSGSTKIFDLKSASPSPVEFIDGYFGIGMEFNADTLYICSGLNNAITKHDVTDSISASTATTLLSGLSFPAAAGIYNGEFYFAETSSGDIAKVSLYPPYNKTVLFNGNTPRRLAIHNGVLYVAMAGDGNIVTYDLNATSIKDLEVENQDRELVKIFDVLGKETLPTKNKLLIYVYSDGTREKVILK